MVFISSEYEATLFHTGHQIPVWLRTRLTRVGEEPTGAQEFSWISPLPLVEPFTPLERDTHPSTTYCATWNNKTGHQRHAGFNPLPQKTSEFVLCLPSASLLRLSLALSTCEFAECLRALIPSPIPTGTRQHSFRLGEPALLINLDSGHTSRAFCFFLLDNISHLATRCYLLLPSPRKIEYSNDTFIFVLPPHLLYHSPSPSIMIVAIMSVWTVSFLWQIGCWLKDLLEGPQLDSGFIGYCAAAGLGYIVVVHWVMSTKHCQNKTVTFCSGF